MANSNLPAGVTLRDIDNLCREPDYDGDDCPDCDGSGWIVDGCFDPCPTCNPEGKQ